MKRKNIVGLIAVVVIAAVLIFSGCVEKEGVTSSTHRPIAPTPEEGQIKSLAYIKVMPSGYTDDADPEYEGVAIDISYYDEKSETINFKNIPLNVTIRFYGYHSISETFNHDKMELIYEKSVTVDHSMRLNEMFGKYIRISFDDFSVDSNKYYKFGTVKVTVETPNQKKFSDDADLVPLYVK